MIYTCYSRSTFHRVRLKATVQNCYGAAPPIPPTTEPMLSNIAVRANMPAAVRTVVTPTLVISTNALRA